MANVRVSVDSAFDKGQFGPGKSGWKMWCVDVMAIPVIGFQDQGYKIRKGFCIKINIPKEKFWILRFGLMGSLSSLQKIRVFQVDYYDFSWKKLKK